jgi:hypothetical protein
MYTVENLFHFSVVALFLNFDKIILRVFFSQSEIKNKKMKALGEKGEQDLEDKTIVLKKLNR